MNFDMDDFLRVPGEVGLDVGGRLVGIAFLSLWMIVLQCIVGAAGIGLLIAAARASEGSFVQSLCIELASGAAFFVVAPLLLQAWHTLGSKASMFTLGLAAAAFVGAARVPGVWQSLLLEVSVGLVILVILEFWLSRYFTYLKAKRDALADREHLA
jgi:hypothetical protein